VKTRIHIIDNVTGQLAEAEIFDEVTVEHFIETQQNWRPIRTEGSQTACGSR
jgi:hypothetical protein